MSSTYQSTEVRMCTDTSRGLVRWVLDATSFTSTKLISQVTFGKFAFRQPEFLFEDSEDSVVNLHGFAHKRNDSIFHPGIHSGGICAVCRARPRQCIILRNVQELRSVLGPMYICCDRAASLIAIGAMSIIHIAIMNGRFLPKRSPVIPLFEKHLLLKR